MKKNIFRKLITGALTLGVGISVLTGCGQAQTQEADNKADNNAEASSKVYRTVDEIKESGEINIGVFSDKNPFGYIDENAIIRDMTCTLPTESGKTSE